MNRDDNRMWPGARRLVEPGRNYARAAVDLVERWVLDKLRLAERARVETADLAEGPARQCAVIERTRAESEYERVASATNQSSRSMIIPSVATLHFNADLRSLMIACALA